MLFPEEDHLFDCQIFSFACTSLCRVEDMSISTLTFSLMWTDLQLTFKLYWSELKIVGSGIICLFILFQHEDLLCSWSNNIFFFIRECLHGQVKGTTEIGEVRLWNRFRLLFFNERVRVHGFKDIMKTFYYWTAPIFSPLCLNIWDTNF